MVDKITSSEWITMANKISNKRMNHCRVDKIITKEWIR